MRTKCERNRGLWELDIGHSPSPKVVESERRTPETLLVVLGIANED